jgi:hypothetical protein
VNEVRRDNGKEQIVIDGNNLCWSSDAGIDYSRYHPGLHDDSLSIKAMKNMVLKN